MHSYLSLIPLLLVTSEAFAQSEVNDPSKFELTNNVVQERSYTLPNADHALNADQAGHASNASRLNGRSASFFRNASNLNTGKLNNARLASDLGNRTIARARHADLSTEAQTTTTSRASAQLGEPITFLQKIRYFEPTTVQSYDIPNNASSVMAEAYCRGNDARVSVYFDAGFTKELQLCRSRTTYGTSTKEGGATVNTNNSRTPILQFDVPKGARQLFVQQLTAQGSTDGSIQWLGSN